MKQEKKAILKLLIFGTIFMLYGCSEDLYEEQINQSNFKLKYVGSKSLQKNEELMKILNKNKFKKGVLNSSKIVNDTINGFSIDTDNVKYLETSIYNSYTFKILNQETEFLDNLVLLSQSNGSYTPYIYRYNLTTEEKLALNTNTPIDFTNKTKVLKLYDSNIVSDIFSKLDYIEECSILSSWEEVMEIEPNYDQCNCYGNMFNVSYSHVLVTTMVCSGGNIGGGEGSSGGTSPHGGGGSSSTPVTNPCNKIKNQNTKYPSIKQSLSDLTNSTSQNHENGVFIDNTATATTPNPVQTISPNTTTGGSVPLNMNPPNKYVMIAHTHDASGSDGTGTFSIFSWGDLLAIANLIHNNHIDDSFVFYVITADGTKYAMTIDWPSAFAEYFDITTNPDNPSQIGYYNGVKAKELSRTSDKYYNNNPLPNRITRTSNPVDDQKIFLNMIKDLKLDVSLFKVDATFTTYTKLVLENNAVVPKPCN